MRGLRRIGVVVALGLAAQGGAAKPKAAWRDSMPAGWLVAVEVTDLAAADATLARLAGPWEVKAPSLAMLASRLLPGVELDAVSPWGLALAPDAAGGVTPSLYAPAPDFEAACMALDADVVGELAVAQVVGYDVALADRGQWVEITLLDARPEPSDEADDVARLSAADLPLEGNVTVAISPRGLRLAAESLTRRRRGQIDAGQGRVGPWKWPAQMAGYADALAPYHPLVDELAAWKAPLQIACGATDGALTFRVSSGAIRGDSPGQPAPKLRVEGLPIASLSAAGPIPARLVDLAVAYLRCRPDEIDAAEYPQPPWDDLAEAYRALVSRYRGIATTLVLPEGGAPLATNQLASFGWDGPRNELGDALQLATLRWNQLIDAAAPPSPLRIEMAPLAEGREGWRLTTDLFEGFALERSPEVEAVFERYYGDDVLAIEVERNGDGPWRVGYGPKGPESEASPAASQAAAPFVAGELRLDRWLAWKQRVEDADMADAIGHRSRPPMADSPPAMLRAELNESGLRVEATLPWPTYGAAVEWRRRQ